MAKLHFPLILKFKSLLSSAILTGYNIVNIIEKSLAAYILFISCFIIYLGETYNAGKY